MPKKLFTCLKKNLSQIKLQSFMPIPKSFGVLWLSNHSPILKTTARRLQLQRLRLQFRLRVCRRKSRTRNAGHNGRLQVKIFAKFHEVLHRLLRRKSIKEGFSKRLIQASIETLYAREFIRFDINKSLFGLFESLMNGFAQK